MKGKMNSETLVINYSENKADLYIEALKEKCQFIESLS